MAATAAVASSMATKALDCEARVSAEAAAVSADVGRQELTAADLRLRLVGHITPCPVAGHQAPAIAFADLHARFRWCAFGTIPACLPVVGGQGGVRVYGDHGDRQEYRWERKSNRHQDSRPSPGTAF